MEIVVNHRVFTEVAQGRSDFGVKVRHTREESRNNPERRRNIILAAALQQGYKPIPAATGSLDLATLAHHPGLVRFLQEAHSKWHANGHDLSFASDCVEDGFVPYFCLKTGGEGPPGDTVEAAAAFYATDNMTPIYADTASTLADDMGVVQKAVETLSTSTMVYALTTMPGHHAGPHHYGGYCYLNNAVIAAKMLQARGHRVAVLDVDYHGGDGTHKFSLPFYMSIHVHDDYPYVDMGSNGYEINPHIKWPEYKSVLQRILDGWSGSVDTIVVSLGFDTLSGDPDAREGYGQQLTPADFTGMAMVLAKTECKLLVVQEGGYRLSDVGQAATAFLSGCFAHLT